jgi:hypothetical protein
MEARQVKEQRSAGGEGNQETYDGAKVVRENGH